MGQPVAFFEVISPDHERAQKFYSELFGWQVAADPAMGGYGLVDTGAGDGAIGGGIGPSSAPGEAGVKIYMRVDDLDAYLDRAEQLAVELLRPLVVRADDLEERHWLTHGSAPFLSSVSVC